MYLRRESTNFLAKRYYLVAQFVEMSSFGAVSLTLVIGRPTLKPLGSWCRELWARGDRLGAWAAAPRSPPPLCWLPALLAPTGFLTAVMQVR